MVIGHTNAMSTPSLSAMSLSFCFFSSSLQFGSPCLLSYSLARSRRRRNSSISNAVGNGTVGTGDTGGSGGITYGCGGQYRRNQSSVFESITIDKVHMVHLRHRNIAVSA